MNNLNVDPTGSIVLGLLATAFMALSSTSGSLVAAEVESEPYFEPAYRLIGMGASMGSNFSIDLVNLSCMSLEQVVSEAYEHLLVNQESLGVEFSRVLYDNLENLYES